MPDEGAVGCVTHSDQPRDDTFLLNAPDYRFHDFVMSQA
jgi:hypothetical protein